MTEYDTPTPFPETRPEPTAGEPATGWDGYSPEILDAILDP